jgi:putative addiction module killer protein
VETKEFEKWLKDQTLKSQVIIHSRLERLKSEGHWGYINRFDDLVELKWKSGVRIYTALYGMTTIIVLLGGNKNGQNKDIKKAKNILIKFIEKI